MAMPSPGAVCPAMVMQGLEMVSLLCRSMVPETLKTTMRGPSASTAARRLPGPESSRFVTAITLPPRPPFVREPWPSAPGKEGR